MGASEILSYLPYDKPFLFVDQLEEVNDNGAKGFYTFPEDAFFYEGHFKDFPVTPGVILTECMAQIGLVCLGIFLLGDELRKDAGVALTGTEVDFYLPVLPGEKVAVESEKVFFRFNKLKCKVKMFNEENKLVCRGEIAGMIKSHG